MPLPVTALQPAPAFSDFTAGVTAGLLHAAAPGCSRPPFSERQAQIIDKTVRCLPMVLRVAAINTDLRLAHFLAQIAHESDGFCTVEEYAGGQAYEGRKDLGNVRRGDGRSYKGRGLIQLTGRANYAAFTRWMKENRTVIPCNNPPDFEAAPQLLAVFPYAVLGAGWYWRLKRLNSFADRDDLNRITRAVNGGLDGLENRRACLARIKKLLKIDGGELAA